MNSDWLHLLLEHNNNNKKQTFIRHSVLNRYSLHQPIPQNSCSIIKLPASQKINHRSQLMSPVSTPSDCLVIIPLIMTIIIIIISLLQFITPALKKGWYNGLSGSYSIYWLVVRCKPCCMLFSPLTESVWELTSYCRVLNYRAVKRQTHQTNNWQWAGI